MNIKKVIIINTIFQVVGKAITFLLSFLSIFLLTRYLGLSGYGNFTLVFSYLSFFAIISDMGLGLLIVRDISGSDRLINKSLNLYISIKIVLTLVAILSGLITLIFIPYSSEMKIGIFVGSIAVLISSFTSLGTSLLQAKLRMDLVTIIDQITKIFTVLCISLFVLYKKDFYFIISAVIIGNLFGFFTTVYLIKKEFNITKINWSINKFFDLNKTIVKNSILFGLMTLFAFTYFKIDSLILSIYKSSSDLSIYTLAYKIIENILLIWSFYMASIFPLFSKYASKPTEAYKYFINSIKIAGVFSLVCGYIGIFHSGLIIEMFGGPNFIQSIIPLRILMFSLPIFFINNILYHLFISRNKIKQIIISLIISLIINMVLNIVFVPNYGYIATSYITLITELMLLISYSYIFFNSKIFSIYNKYD